MVQNTIAYTINDQVFFQVGRNAKPDTICRLLFCLRSFIKISVSCKRNNYTDSVHIPEKQVCV